MGVWAGGHQNVDQAATALLGGSSFLTPACLFCISRCCWSCFLSLQVTGCKMQPLWLGGDAGGLPRLLQSENLGGVEGEGEKEKSAG